MTVSETKIQRLRRERDRVVRDACNQLGRYPNIRLSYWAFNKYRTCPQQYVMATVGRRPDRPKEDRFHAITGSVVHSLTEDFIGGVKNGAHDWGDRDFLQDHLISYYDRFVTSDEHYIDWREQNTTPAEYKHDVIPLLRTSVNNVYDMMIQEGLLPHDPRYVHQEFSFRTPLADGAIELTGRSDLVFEYPNYIKVIDLKDVASRDKVDWRQLVWYSFGVEPFFNKPVEQAGFLLTKLGQWSWRKPNARHPKANGKTSRDVLWDEILDVVTKIRRGPFPAEVSRYHCHWCPVKDQCPEWFEYAGQTADILAQVAGVLDGNISF